jgi:DHA1 family multidrug resistance protein-like MFS transporter
MNDKHAWKRTLYILAFVQFVSAVGMSSIFTFLPLYVEELGSTAGLSVELMAGLVFSVQAFAMMLAAPVWGALADRHGRKRMVLRATWGGTLVILLMGFVTSAEQLVVLRAIQGLITGIFSALTALVAASVPRERMGYALGLLQVGLWSGASTGPLFGGLIADTLGFRASFSATAALLAVAGGLTWWGVHEHFEPLPRTATGRNGFLVAWEHVLSVQAVRLTFLARFLTALARTMIEPFTPLFVLYLMGGQGQTATVTGVLLALSAAAGTVAAIYLGRLGDRLGHRRVLITIAVTAGLLYLPLSLVTSVWQMAILFTLTGAAAGGILPTLSALLATHTDPGEEGAVYGLEAAIISAGRAAAPMIGAGLATVAGLRSIYVTGGLVFLVIAFVIARWLPAIAVAAPRPSSRTV